MLSKKNESFFSKYSLFILLSIYIFLHLFFIDFEQIWDGRDYLNVILNNIKSPYAIEGYNAYGHPSLAYFFYLSIGQQLSFENQYLINIQNILLGCVGIFYFLKTAQLFFNKIQSFFATLLFTLSPLGFAVSIQLNLDFALMIFLVGVIYSILYTSKILVVINTLGLCLSKEPGMYLLICTLIFIFIIFRNDFTTTIKKNKISISLFLIIGIILTYLITSKSTNSIGWGGFYFDFTRFNIFLKFTSLINFLCAILAHFFILNYNWIFSTIIALSIIFKRLKPEFISPKFNSKYFKLGIGIIAAYFILNLIYPLFISAGIFTNPRYTVATLPMLYLVSVYALFTFNIQEKFKYLISIFIAILLSSQVFFTTDPISKAVYGTFEFGNHKMLKMTSITNECCGIGGRDQLVYNAQFTNINTLIKKITKEFESEKSIPFVISDEGNFYTFHEPNRQIIDVKQLINLYLQNIPSKCIYINLPWMTDKKRDLGLLKKYYTVKDEKRISANGYSLEYFLLEKFK